MDLPSVIASLPGNYGHLIAPLESHDITTTDLLTLDALEIARRTGQPLLDIRQLANSVSAALRATMGIAPDGRISSGVSPASAEPQCFRHTGNQLVERWRCISTLDENIDAALGGGIAPGYVTEITGESGVGKTQLLLTLLLAVQLPPPRGLQRKALYISTEAALSTPRLNQLLSTHPQLAHLPPAQKKPSLHAIFGMHVPDLEFQDHILQYQLPVSVRREKVGLVVIDSVTAHYRAEFERGRGNMANMARRSAELVQLGSLLRDLARMEDVAIVVANQVTDRFVRENAGASQPSGSSSHALPAGKGTLAGAIDASGGTSALDAGFNSLGSFPPDILTLDHQHQWFTGWGDEEADAAGEPTYKTPNLKTPALGHTWTLQLSARIALVKEPLINPAVADDDDGVSLADQTLPGGMAASSSNSLLSMGRDGQDGRNRADKGASSQRGDALLWKRRLKLVFAPWAAPTLTTEEGVEFNISAEGITTRAS